MPSTPSLPAPPQLYPTLTRARSGRVVAGAAAGLAEHFGISVRWVRVAFTLAAFAGGLGLTLYALLWVFTPLRSQEDAPTAAAGAQAAGDTWPRAAYYLLVAIGVAGAAIQLSLVSGYSGVVVFVLGVVAVGALVAWQAYDRGLSSVPNLLALCLGVTLVMGGVVAIALLGDTAGTTGVVVAVLATIFGISLLVIPLVVRLANSLMEERKAKAMADQRSEIASRLHDSVLQTLALIQKRAADPAEVARLARSQERELRAWLFDADAAPEDTLTLFGALAKAAGEVEDLHGVTIRPVTVGDDMDYSLATEPVVLAAREAMVNAAKHAGVDQVDVYAEHLAGELSVYIRDRGVGFDADAIPPDRHGVRDSIIGRMERAGGSATISRAAGNGTEVVLSMAV
ncbi:PspC domain-containing protein [Corynebacterium sp.]|uniref:ATP-binding protein n=1 Tax=Corynebacterium sp. TaxID=1720 RepID=UPI002A917B0E|nr:PspC domain-containing protein [Corynebacterium sp.]MDY5785916.1 PspC domain-containing protein [Corynebacterium sp.]